MKEKTRHICGCNPSFNLFNLTENQSEMLFHIKLYLKNCQDFAKLKTKSKITIENRAHNRLKIRRRAFLTFVTCVSPSSFARKY